MHRVLVEPMTDDLAGRELVVTGEEAHHAVRVKRLEPGAPVELVDGHGRVGTGTHESVVKLGKKDGWALRVRVDSVSVVEPHAPEVRVVGAVPKGPRLETMIDQLAQVGAASWRPLVTARSVVDPRGGKLDRLERVSLGALKQSGRAWALRIERGQHLSSVFEGAEGARVVAADASGERYEPVGDGRPVTLLVGPEGGWTDAELAAVRKRGAEVVRFGVHVMRIETAAVAAAAIVLEAEHAATHISGGA
ncbi:MAG: RsmE family RNA methyltransferase [Planctomycetota bacterium]